MNKTKIIQLFVVLLVVAVASTSILTGAKNTETNKGGTKKEIRELRAQLEALQQQMDSQPTIVFGNFTSNDYQYYSGKGFMVDMPESLTDCNDIFIAANGSKRHFVTWHNYNPVLVDPNVDYENNLIYFRVWDILGDGSEFGGSGWPNTRVSINFIAYGI